ncbi:MAG: HAMP domain-containing protein, partial [Acidobacteria bacterium]|nr:HAMP domain-containing protein [Acidobacteriota bacterium]
MILVALVIRIISRPLRRLTERAVTVAGGDYGAQFELKSNDEVGLLAASFNEMSRKMAADIEQLRTLNEHLVRAEKLAAAGTLAAGVAHEVNNPLASISSLIQILQSRLPEDPEDRRAAETREMLRLVSTQIARITQVTRDMMDFARQRPPERAPLDVRRLLYLKCRRYRGQLWGNQLAAILWALVITGVLKTAANILFPLAGVYSLLPYSSVFVLPGVLVYAYAVSNFKLFSLQSALDQFRLFPIAYKVALSIAAVAVTSFLLIQIPIVWWSFGAELNAAEWKRYLVFSVITALVPNLILVALVIRIISRPLRRLTE